MGLCQPYDGIRGGHRTEPLTVESGLRHYLVVTGGYWAFTLTDGAIRMLVVLYFHSLGYSPFEVWVFIIWRMRRGDSPAPCCPGWSTSSRDWSGVSGGLRRSCWLPDCCRSGCREPLVKVVKNSGQSVAGSDFDFAVRRLLFSGVVAMCPERASRILLVPLCLGFDTGCRSRRPSA